MQHHFLMLPDRPFGEIFTPAMPAVIIQHRVAAPRASSRALQPCVLTHVHTQCPRSAARWAWSARLSFSLPQHLGFNLGNVLGTESIPFRRASPAVVLGALHCEMPPPALQQRQPWHGSRAPLGSHTGHPQQPGWELPALVFCN